MFKKHTQIVALLLVPLIFMTVHGQQTGTARGVVVDKMVAIVDKELITYSDILWQLALQPNSPLDNPSLENLNRVLNLLIDQRLIGQEAGKLPAAAPTDKQIDAALTELINLFPSRSEFQDRITRAGLTAGQLREIVRQRLVIENYLDFRFRSFTIVTPKEVADYYRDVYVPRFRERSPRLIVPTFEQGRAEIEKTLTESKIESDTEAFIDAARERAEIVIISPLGVAATP